MVVIPDGAYNPTEASFANGKTFADYATHQTSWKLAALYGCTATAELYTESIQTVMACFTIG